MKQAICLTMEKPFYELFYEDYNTWERFQTFLQDLDRRLQKATIQILQEAAKNSSNNEKEDDVHVNLSLAEDLMHADISIGLLHRIAANAETLRDHFNAIED